MAVPDAAANMGDNISFIDQVSGDIIHSEPLKGSQIPELQSVVQIGDDWYSVAERNDLRDDASNRIKQVNVFVRRRAAA